MMRMCNPSASHAALHPINRTQQSAVCARAAGSQFASQHMLSYAVLAPRGQLARQMACSSRAIPLS